MKKIYAILFLCSALVAPAQNYRIGDVYTAPDGSQGVVYYLHSDGSGGWVVALNDASSGCAWGTSADLPGLLNQNSSYSQQLLNDTAGYANTQTLRNYQNNSTTYAAATVDFAHGWVLPSPAQLSILYGQLPFITTAITDAGGTALAYANYWCSAEHSASNAWCVEFGSNYWTGYFNNIAKNTSCRVRAVRSFSYPATIVHDTSLTYQWNTGSTQPYLNASPSQTTTYTVTGTTEFGCSNTAEQMIVVGTGTPQTIYDTICKGAGYEANGFSLTAEETQTVGTLTRTRTMTTSGCSSNLTLQLKVNEPVTELVEATAFGSYIRNGVTYYESGDYTQTFTAANGCDSVVTLRLTLTDSPEVTVTASDDTVCAGDAVTLAAVVQNASAVVIPPPPPAVAIGDILCTDGSTVKPSAYASSGKTAMGVVFYVDNTGEHGWAVHLQDQGTNIVWGNTVDIPYLNNFPDARDAITDMDGYNNTFSIRYYNNSYAYPAAWLVDFDNGWYLPACGQLKILHAERAIVNNSLQIVNGTPMPVGSSEWTYWSSTEKSATSAGTVDSFGHVNSLSKSANLANVRSVRSF